jgi:uncharacterized caspase-like protein
MWHWPWLFLILLAWSAARAEVRVVIFASDYQQAADTRLRLPNTLVDAQAVAKLFHRLAVADVRLVPNPTASIWQQQISDLIARLHPDDIAVLYYAGHAVQADGQNYFLSADGTSLVAAEQVLSGVMAHARGALFFIDACRDNPFRANAARALQELEVRDLPQGDNRGWSRSGTGKTPVPELGRTLPVTALSAGNDGLSQMGNVRGANAIVVFSTEPGNVAVDGVAGRGSPFANAVVSQLQMRQSLDTALRNITVDVNRATHGKQSPWRQGDLGFPLFLAGEARYDVPPAF